MKYDDVIGQAAIKARLRRQVVEGRVPHAQLFCGPSGVGKLPMALALASSLLCTNRTPEGDPCGCCAGCKMVARYAHPDLHFIFPTIRKGSTSSSDTYLEAPLDFPLLRQPRLVGSAASGESATHFLRSR